MYSVANFFFCVVDSSSHIREARAGMAGIGLMLEERLRLLSHQRHAEKEALETELEKAVQERELGEMRQLLICVEKQLSLLAQGDKWGDVSRLFHNFLLLVGTPEQAIPE
jgi:hypothetical protein